MAARAKKMKAGGGEGDGGGEGVGECEAEVTKKESVAREDGGGFPWCSETRERKREAEGELGGGVGLGLEGGFDGIDGDGLGRRRWRKRSGGVGGVDEFEWSGLPEAVSLPVILKR